MRYNNYIQYPFLGILKPMVKQGFIHAFCRLIGCFLFYDSDMATIKELNLVVKQPVIRIG